MKDSILLTKSKAFALRIVRLYKHLRERKESVIAKLMRECARDALKASR
jgi:hypothetical protein